jgi:hypothetical protein
MVNLERRSKPVAVSSMAGETGRCAPAGMDRRYTAAEQRPTTNNNKLSRTNG